MTVIRSLKGSNEIATRFVPFRDMIILLLVTSGFTRRYFIRHLRRRAIYERLCTSLDHQIDDLVYQLYDITPDERKIIEKS